MAGKLIDVQLTEDEIAIAVASLLTTEQTTTFSDEARLHARVVRLALQYAADRALKPQHVIRGGGPVHAGDCPACLAAEAAGTPFTASPRSETYWSS